MAGLGHMTSARGRPHAEGLIDPHTPWDEDDRAWYVTAVHPGGLTLEQCGQLLGVSRQRVRQIEADALRKLQRQAKSDPDMAAAVREMLRGIEAERGGDESIYAGDRGRFPTQADRSRAPEPSGGKFTRRQWAWRDKTAAVGRTRNALRQLPQEGTDMATEVECASCGNRFERKRGPQKYCDGCKSQGHGGTKPRAATNGKARKRASARAPKGDASERAAELLQLAGFEVETVEAPAGTLLMVTGPE